MLKLSPFANKKPATVSNKIDAIQSNVANKNYALAGMMAKKESMPSAPTAKTSFGF